MNRTIRLIAVLAALALPLPALAQSYQAILYKNPQCGCCDNYAALLRKQGFKIDVKPTEALVEISRKAGVPEELQGCHALFVDGYVVHGHVPVKAVRKMLSEKPAIAGITLPGMPQGSPGMGGAKTEPFTVYAVSKDGAAPSIYLVE